MTMNQRRLLQLPMHVRGINCCLLLLIVLAALPCRADGRAAANYEYDDTDEDWTWALDRGDLEQQQEATLSKRSADALRRQRQRQRRVEEAEDAGWLGLGKRQQPRFTPYLSVGVLSDMQQFFDNLKTNLDALETLPPEDKDSLLGKQVTIPQAAVSGAGAVADESQKERHFRPSATAAYLHALRNHRPSYKIRNFVETPEPVSLRGTNRYDPSLLWTGLGRRRR